MLQQTWQGGEEVSHPGVGGGAFQTRRELYVERPEVGADLGCGRGQGMRGKGFLGGSEEDAKLLEPRTVPDTQ